MKPNAAITAMLLGTFGVIHMGLGSETKPATSRTSQPATSWATVPRGICIWKNKPFTEQDTAAVAKYSLVQTMIPDGIPWRKPGTGNIALEIKKRNPDADRGKERRMDHDGPT